MLFCGYFYNNTPIFVYNQANKLHVFDLESRETLLARGVVDRRNKATLQGLTHVQMTKSKDFVRSKAAILAFSFARAHRNQLSYLQQIPTCT